ncbi:MAG: hypothetical protein WBE54_20765, partial [Bradyrhizobium sp.]
SVQAIAQALPHVTIPLIKKPPRVWVQAGAVGFYGDTGDRLCDENSPAGKDALAGICKQWEKAFNTADTPDTRTVLLRIGFVLGRDGGTSEDDRKAGAAKTTRPPDAGHRSKRR